MAIHIDKPSTWTLTVVRSQGLHLIRPEKSWRPIITVDIEERFQYTTQLGTGGENPNQKDSLQFEAVKPSSRVDIKVWHRPQTKKKSKKLNLIASANPTLGELLRRHEDDPTAKELELQLNCQAIRRSVSSRGKSKNDKNPYIHVRLRPPSNLRRAKAEATDTEEESLLGETASISDATATTDSMPPSPIDEPTKDDQLRRRLKAYYLDSDDEYSNDRSSLKPPPISEVDSFYDDTDSDNTLVQSPPLGPLSWFVASILPQYTEIIVASPSLSRWERFLASFTYYGQLKDACAETQFESVSKRLQLEWTYVGGILVALAAVDTAVFAISPDAMFQVVPYARSAVAASSIAAGLGVTCNAWFLLRYTWIDIDTFMNRARDLYGSYVFFCISARVPLLCLFIAATALMAFLAIVAFDAWPLAVLVLCCGVGLLMSLQFLVFGAHWCGKQVVAGGRAGSRTVVLVVRKLSGNSEPPQT